MQDSSKNKKNQNLRDIFSSLIESNKKSPVKQQQKLKSTEQKTETTIISQSEKTKQANELNIDFSLKGGPLHTDLLVAEAFISSVLLGQREGEPLPLQCKWFTIDESTQARTEIEKVTGAFYQPSIIDILTIKTRIGIEAIPMTQDDISPWYAEVGPIVQDQVVESKAQELISNNEQISFPQKIELISDGNNNNNEDNGDSSILELEQPVQIDLTFGNNGIIITYGEQKKTLFAAGMTQDTPKIKILKYLNNIYEIAITANFSLRFIAKNPSERDLILLIFNYFQTQKKISNLNKEQEQTTQEKVELQQQSPQQSIIKQETKDNSFQNVQLFQKIEQQNKQMSILQQEVAQLRDKILKLRTQKQELKDQFKQTEEIKIELEKKAQQMATNAEDFNDKAQTLLNEKIFYLQEINILKSELKDVNAKLVQYQRHENKQIEETQPQKSQKLEKDQVQKQPAPAHQEEFQKQIQQQAQLIQDLQDQAGYLKNQLSKLENEKEEVQNELNYYRRLNASLIQEKNINVQQDKLNYRKTSFGPNETISKQDHLKMVDQMENEFQQIIIAKQDQIEQLYDKIKSLNITNQMQQFSIKIEFVQSNARKLRQKSSSNENIIDCCFKQLINVSRRIKKNSLHLVQNILIKQANLLAEDLQDKELALETQKNINKELIIQLNELKSTQQN